MVSVLETVWLYPIYTCVQDITKQNIYPYMKGEHPMKPRRSILSVPGHVEKMTAKDLNSEADVVMLDM